MTALVAVSEDPYDALHSRPTDDPLERSAIFDKGRGFVLFLVDDAARIMTVYHVTWAG